MRIRRLLLFAINCVVRAADRKLGTRQLTDYRLLLYKKRRAFPPHSINKASTARRRQPNPTFKRWAVEGHRFTY